MQEGKGKTPGGFFHGISPERTKHVIVLVLLVVVLTDVAIFSWFRTAREADTVRPPARLRRLMRWGIDKPAAGNANAVSSLVTIFSAECSTYHDWQAVVLYDSWKAAKVPGKLVRILACSQEQRKTYARMNSIGDGMETHVHEKGEVAGINYSPLNKPWGIKSWLTDGEGAKLPNNTVILIVDPDMSFRTHGVPGDLAALAERASLLEGVALGLDYQYTVAGMRAQKWALPRHFNASTNVKDLQSIGPPILMRKDSLKRLAHGWYDITLQIVSNQTQWNMVHDGQQFAPWIAEMYGYTLAAAGWLRHETQAQWAELEAPQPPFASTGGRYLPDPLLIHYSHPFQLCGQNFGKYQYKYLDPLKCSNDVTEKLRPPAYKDLHACKLCIDGGDVIGFKSRCFGSDAGGAYIKQVSWEAWARVARAVFDWRSRHCFGGV